MEVAAFQSPPPLGRVLVECGLLTEEQVSEALQEQERTGRKLGEILVSSGVVSGPAIANALAEQRGTVVKTEYGFGTGLASRRRPAVAGAPPVADPPQNAPIPQAPPQAPAAPDEHDAVADLEADLVSRDARIAELQAELGRRAVKAEGLHARISDLEARLAEGGERVPVADPGAPAGPAPSQQGDYVVLLPGEAGFKVIARHGAAPPPGSTVAVDGAVFVATTIGRSPLPGDGRPCVFLAAAS